MESVQTFILILILALGPGTQSENPGFVVRITQKGLDYARQQGMIALQKELWKIQLPDFSGSYHVDVIGNVHYSFHSLVIRNVQLPGSQVSLLPNVGLKVTISGAFIQLGGQWKVRYAFISNDGDFDLKVEGISISVGLSLGSDAIGRPTVSPSDCSCHIADIDVHFSGSFGWLINLFHDSIESGLRSALEDKICPSVIDSINSQLEPLLQTLPVTAKIDKVAAIDYSLMGRPTVTADYVDAQLKGEFFELSHRSTPPFSPPPLSLPDDHDLMVYFGASEYLFNSAGFVYQSAGALVFNVTDDMIPKDFSIRLNTSAFGALIPQISKMYPDMLMKLQISSPTSPSLNIVPGNLTISPVLHIQAYAILPNSSLVPLFLLELTTQALVKVAMNVGRIQGHLELSKIQIELKHSDVGPFSVSLLNMAVNYYVSNILLPRVNDILQKGYPFPLLDHIQLSDVVIKPYQHFLLFGANVHYG
ncbi:bactericidal permeability-increasing [Pelobates cultripes]|uniref:Bactericidal permeability-increasing protein n=1 Tax=Pelobates cultripes TaxID=61616 RepID=A0AAD1S609_PELCU|nr:bactericidal permeability-increasing [Pelobates cultripes]